MGQIDGDTFSTFIQSYSSNDQYKTFLEIGTWNGLGSTKHFVQTLSTRDDDFVFYSLECNADKAQQAIELYQHIPKVHILNEVIWNEEPADFYEIFPLRLLTPRILYSLLHTSLESILVHLSFAIQNDDLDCFDPRLDNEHFSAFGYTSH